MTLSRDELARIQRLRDLFLDDDRGDRALADYWRDDADLVAYDAVLGARIGWKWDAALAEAADRGFRRADTQVVLDYGCGTGIAARRFAACFGAGEVLCHDRSARAAEFAARSLRASSPAVAARSLRSVDGVAPDVLLVSHVLGELDDAGERQLRAVIERSARVVLVEPGNRRVARRLSQLRDSLLGAFHVAAPCPHALACPALARADDWCHFFAPPPPSVFTDSEQVRTAKALGIDARSLPYSFLALVRGPAAEPMAVPPRLLGRPQVHPHTVCVQTCAADGLQRRELQKRRHPELWKLLKRAPETLRHLPDGFA